MILALDAATRHSLTEWALWIIIIGIIIIGLILMAIGFLKFRLLRRVRLVA